MNPNLNLQSLKSKPEESEPKESTTPVDTSDPLPPVTEIEPVDVPESETESTGVVTETELATSVAEAEPPTSGAEMEPIVAKTDSATKAEVKETEIVTIVAVAETTATVTTVAEA